MRFLSIACFDNPEEHGRQLLASAAAFGIRYEFVQYKEKWHNFYINKIVRMREIMREMPDDFYFVSDLSDSIITGGLDRITEVVNRRYKEGTVLFCADIGIASVYNCWRCEKEIEAAVPFLPKRKWRPGQRALGYGYPDKELEEFCFPCCGSSCGTREAYLLYYDEVINTHDNYQCQWNCDRCKSAWNYCDQLLTVNTLMRVPDLIDIDYNQEVIANYCGTYDDIFLINDMRHKGVHPNEECGDAVVLHSGSHFKPINALGNLYKRDLMFMTPDNFYEFVKDVDKVQLEINSGCNIKCNYCAAAFTGYHNENHIMEIEMRHEIIDTLKKIGWNGHLDLHRYNEPLIEYDALLETICYARENLIGCTIGFNTNGILLTMDRINEIHLAGCNFIDVSLHGQVGEDKIVGKQKMSAFLQKIQRTEKIEEINDRFTFQYMIGDEPCQTRVLGYSMFWDKLRFNGGCLGLKYHLRTNGCNETKAYCGIDAYGNVYPCCQIVKNTCPDWIIGNLHDGGLIPLYNSVKWRAIRQSNKWNGDIPLPCRNCNR